MKEHEHADSRRGMIAAVICNTIFGLSFIFSRVALANTQPSILLTLRFGIALLIMIVLVLTGIYKLRLRGKPVGLLLLAGLCQPVLYFLCESYGIKYTNASFSGLMIALIPLISTVFSVIFLHEELRKSKILWILGALLGVGIITVTQSSSGVIQMRGVLYMTFAVLVASAFSVLSRSLSAKFTSFERTFVMMVLGFLAFFMMAVIQEGAGFGAEAVRAVQNRDVMIPALFLAVCSSVIAFFLQNISISELTVQRAMAFANLAPIVSVIAGVLVLHEPFTVPYLIGIVLILVSLYRMNRE